MLSGLRRLYTDDPRQARPLLADELRALLAGIDTSNTADQRDRALLALGWAGALRESEIVELDWHRHGGGTGYVRLTGSRGRERDHAAVIVLTKSKASQAAAVRIVVPMADMPTASRGPGDMGQRRQAGTPAAPVFCAIIRERRLTTERLQPNAVSRIVRRRVREFHIDAGTAEADEIAEASSGHSLRAGFITSAAQSGVPEFKIGERARHKSAEQTARYIRPVQEHSDFSFARGGVLMLITLPPGFGTNARGKAVDPLIAIVAGGVAGLGLVWAFDRFREIIGILRERALERRQAAEQAALHEAAADQRIAAAAAAREAEEAAASLADDLPRVEELRESYATLSDRLLEERARDDAITRRMATVARNIDQMRESRDLRYAGDPDAQAETDRRIADEESDYAVALIRSGPKSSPTSRGSPSASPRSAMRMRRRSSPARKRSESASHEHWRSTSSRSPPCARLSLAT